MSADRHNSNRAAATPVAVDTASTARVAAQVSRPGLRKAAADPQRERFRRVFVLGMQRLGYTHADIAAHTHRPRETVSKWALTGFTETPGVSDYLLFPRDLRLFVATELHAADRANVVSSEPDQLTHQARMHVLTCELTDVIRVYSEALARGGVTPSARAEMLREMREAQDALAGACMALQLEAVG